ncbi:hypothetical protein A0H81_07761 [Grifola frondosa]|uniref:Uncharacterized protein n=1 Tax=Grifola frondosa TaxID=5627 RepID=A0A1C7M6M1_GRIFR|nr:hypothetical protein A0H81_07761 [Grifola frondosa]
MCKIHGIRGDWGDVGDGNGHDAEENRRDQDRKSEETEMRTTCVKSLAGRGWQSLAVARGGLAHRGPACFSAASLSHRPTNIRQEPSLPPPASCLSSVVCASTVSSPLFSQPVAATSSSLVCLSCLSSPLFASAELASPQCHLLLRIPRRSKIFSRRTCALPATPLRVLPVRHGNHLRKYFLLFTSFLPFSH